jgi:hypothetical protein
MEYTDGTIWITQLLNVLESGKITIEVFHSKLEPIRLSLLQRAQGFEQSKRNVIYVFKRVAAYAEQGRFENADRAAIRTELYLLETCASFEPRAAQSAGREGAPEK